MKLLFVQEKILPFFITLLVELCELARDCYMKGTLSTRMHIEHGKESFTDRFIIENKTQHNTSSRYVPIVLLGQD